MGTEGPSGLVSGATQIGHWIVADPLRWRLVEHVRQLSLPDCWVGAGFVRDLVWARLHNQGVDLSSDVDVIWFDKARSSEVLDLQLEERLRDVDPTVQWSVKNQARMHMRNGDPHYSSSSDAMRHWPEVATAIAARRAEDGTCEICAPFGTDDLFELVVRPTRNFRSDKRDQFLDRVTRKLWLQRFPRLKLVY